MRVHLLIRAGTVNKERLNVEEITGGLKWGALALWKNHRKEMSLHGAALAH